jgi:hypothetical protein
MLADELDRFRAARCFPHDLKPLLFEQVSDARSEEVVIVDDQNAERFGLALLCFLHCLGQLFSPWTLEV